DRLPCCVEGVHRPRGGTDGGCYRRVVEFLEFGGDDSAALTAVNPAKDVVVQHHHREVQPELHGGHQRVQGHREAAVAAHGHGGPAREVDRHRHRRGNRVGH